MTHSNSVMCFYLLFNSLTVFTFVYSIASVIANLRLGSESTETRVLKIMYMKLTVLTTIFNTIFSPWLMTIEVMFINAIVANLFLAIVVGQVRFLIIGMLCVVNVVFLFSSCGDVYEQALKTLDSWMLLLHRREFRKFYRSCLPWRISLGGFYFVDKALVLTILSVVVHQTLNLLLTYRSDKSL
ncbi:unnamed protein product [Allacma fusca]|uniref:Uncharacterized protein n=1 Tax=Allacma fusca TaxID=39272 RepID=A0A8J2KEH0_9HEXA|nr:unnamed protein product [Allacma fusca]